MEKTSNSISTGTARTSKQAHPLKPITAPSPETRLEKSPSKQQSIVNLLLRDCGATLDEMVAATSWLPHTIRAALTGLRKKGYAISSDKDRGVRTYRATAPQ